MFVPEAPPKDKKTVPRPGEVGVDVRTGKFGNPTSHKSNDGLVSGKHKVTITTRNHAPLPANLIPPEYADYKNTPLEVDTAQQPFELKVRKP